MARLIAAVMDLIFLLGLVWTVIRTAQGFMRQRKGTGGKSTPRKKPEATQGRTARDPVCRMFVSTEVSHRLNVGKETLHFCSEDCLHKYEQAAASRAANQ